MQKHVFQLESGEEFTIPAHTLEQAWLGAIYFLSAEGLLDDLATLSYNGIRN